ncbi:hypothetical protein [Nonomuraea sp. NPDC050786]|uniref:hypothetical protein n=1 Tax=Nonomuraea sp. NPDC050786 TaxID=3154840 RepID=UPI0033EFCF7A
MTAYPIPENHGHWWLTTFKGWHRLHAVPGEALTVEAHREAIDGFEPYVRATACGRTLALTYAGMSSRFSMPRCAACCRALGIESGPGTPVNEAAEKRARGEREASPET